MYEAILIAKITNSVFLFYIFIIYTNSLALLETQVHPKAN